MIICLILRGGNLLEDEDLTILDVAFLDIYMGAQHGMDVAKALRGKNYYGVIVFCTVTTDIPVFFGRIDIYLKIANPQTVKSPWVRLLVEII